MLSCSIGCLARKLLMPISFHRLIRQIAGFTDTLLRRSSTGTAGWLTRCLPILLLSGCAQITHQPTLAGKAWDVRHRRMLTLSEVMRHAAAVDIVLIGETHDNPTHHAIETALLETLSARRAAVLVMEQYDLEQQPALDAIARSRDNPLMRLTALQKLMGTGWEWPGYQPLLAAAVHNNLPVIAANASRANLRQVALQGFDALGPDNAARLGLDTGWSKPQQTLLLGEIAEGHCGSLPAEAVSAIALAQRARDALMADRILAQSAAPIIAVLGRGHVRHDIGVPVYLKRRAENRRFITIGLVEAGDSNVASDYDSSALGVLYDYVVFSAPTPRKSDPCEAFAPASKK